MADMSTVEDIDIENMKVIDLKKKLKDLGLPTTGNKPELVERLQEALISGTDIAGIDSKGVDSSDLDSALLLGTETIHSSHSLADNSKLLEEELLFSSPEKENVTGKELQIQASTKPLKKRLIVETSDTITKPAKKIVLKRDNIIIPKSVNEIPASPVKSVEMPTNNKSKITMGSEATENTDKSDADSVAKLSGGAVKTLSDKERINLRAKRFNITAPETTSSGKVAVSINRNKLTNVFSSSVVDPPSLDVLRKRAERFGQNVSSTMKKLEEQEKLLKRKSKFGATIGGVVSGDDQEKKKKRAERFAS